MSQCTATLHCHGRSWRCTRPAAKKHNSLYCGRCAPKPVRCAAITVPREVVTDGRVDVIGYDAQGWHHKADCAGCEHPCCAQQPIPPTGYIPAI